MRGTSCFSDAALAQSKRQSVINHDFHPLNQGEVVVGAAQKRPRQELQHEQKNVPFSGRSLDLCGLCSGRLCCL
jgi:hypothetical protein